MHPDSCQRCGQAGKSFTNYPGLPQLSGLCAHCAFAEGQRLGELYKEAPEEAAKELWPVKRCSACGNIERHDPRDYLCEKCRETL